MTDQPDDLFVSTPDDDNLPEGHRSGFVAVIGRPNVGKSTLMNAILKEKIAIVSPKPQTTRLRQLGILTRDDAQIVFVDTPGIHNPKTPLGQFMVNVATDALRDAEVILFVVDMSEPVTSEDRRIAEWVRAAEAQTPVIMVLNKVDTLTDATLLQSRTNDFRALAPSAEQISTVATTGQGVDAILTSLIAKLPLGPRYYPTEQLSDIAMRDIAAEMIREKALIHLEEEVPHGVAVEVNEYKERSKDMTYISATIYVERDTHKGIVIGKGGKMLKQISEEARADLEKFIGTRVYLELWVKVLKNWRRDENALRRFGYRIQKG